MIDPSEDLAVHLLHDSAARSPTLFAYLVAKGGALPDDPSQARAVIRDRWPNMTAEERDLAFTAARNVLRQIASDCTVEAERLHLLYGAVGNG